MNILRIDFQELYERHLGRHSQFGINVQHLASVLGIYLALYGLLYHLVPHMGWLLVLTVPYLIVLALNVPVRVFAACCVFMAVLLTAFWKMPLLPWWVDVAAIVIFHRLQTWSHKFYTEARDMSEFQEKYKKGLTLFFLLSVYELPILLNYLLFATRNGSPAAEPVETAVAARVE